MNNGSITRHNKSHCQNYQSLILSGPAKSSMMMEKTQSSRLCLFLLMVILGAAFALRMQGIYWPKLHPDEPVIGSWIEKSSEGLYIKDRVYPNGAFVLARPVVWTCKVLIGLAEQVKYFCGATDNIRNIRPDGIYLGRWLSVAAGTLVCLLMFLAAARAARSPWAGLAASVLIGFTQYAVEHSHYAETDMIALLVLTTTLWLWVIAKDTSTIKWFILASATAGFAAGTKFTLLTLAPVVLVEALLLAVERCDSAFWLRAVKTLLWGVLWFVVGFAVANPAIVMKFSFFAAGLAAEKQRVFAETMLNLGPLGAEWGVRYLHHLQLGMAYAKSLGYPWLILAVAGIPCVLLTRARRYWTLFLLFPLVFAFYWIFMAPWVRSQEFLFFLPPFAVLAVLPLAELWRGKNHVLRALALVMAVAAVTVNGCNGLRVGKLFGWKDTRLMAREWLNTRVPLASRFAVEPYAEAASPDMLGSPLGIRKIEKHGIEFLNEKQIDYLLRTASIGSRGLENPLTGKLYPGPAQVWERFLAGSELLCSWAPLPLQGTATFISPVIELYGLKKFIPQTYLCVTLPQPALIMNSAQNKAGRQTYFQTCHKLGPASALLIDRLPQTIAVGGPDALERPVFVVLNTMERGAAIKVKGLGINRTIILDPYDTAVVPCPPSKKLQLAPFPTVTLQAEPVKDVVYIPCFARLVFSADEAARICLDTGRPERIFRCLPKMLAETLSADMKAMLAAETGLWPVTGRDKEAALNLPGEINKCLQTEQGTVSINGNSTYYYNQFARARLQSETDIPMESVKELELVLPEEQTNTGVMPSYSRTLLLPILLARGKYELKGEVLLRSTAGNVGNNVPLDVRQDQSKTGKVDHVDLRQGEWLTFTMVIQPDREIQPVLTFQSPVEATVYLRNMTVEWNLTAMLETAIAERALRETAGYRRETTESRQKKVVFEPWLALVDFAYNSGTGEVKCVFEALRDNTPRLAVNFWMFRHGEWRRKQKQSISSKPWLDKGDRQPVSVRLNEVLSAVKDPARLGLGIETDVMWHPGAIPAGEGGYIVSFAGLAGRLHH
jgi:hypothetical protein